MDSSHPLSIHHSRGHISSPVPENISFLKLIKANGYVFIIVYFSYLFSFVFNLMLAHWLGPVAFGLVSLIFRFFGVLLPLLAFGVDGVLIKQIQIYISEHDYSKLKGLLQWSGFVFITVSFVYFLWVYLVWIFPSSSVFTWENFYQEIDIFLKGSWLPPLLTFMYIQGALLRSLRCYYSSAFFSWASTLLFASILMVAWHEYFGVLTTANAFWCTGLAAGISILIQFFIIVKMLPLESYQATPSYESKTWFYLSFFIMLSNTLSTVSALVTMILIDILGSSKEEVARFFVCFIIANVFVMLTQATTMLIAPWISLLQKDSKSNALKWLIDVTNNFKLLTGMCFLLLIALFGNSILHWFGRAYSDLYQPLMIFSVMNYIAVCFGSSPTLLMFSNLQKLLDKLRIIQVIILIFIGSIMIYYFDVVGAVIADGVSLIIFELLSTWQARKHLNLSMFGI